MGEKVIIECADSCPGSDGPIDMDSVKTYECEQVSNGKLYQWISPYCPSCGLALDDFIAVCVRCGKNPAGDADLCDECRQGTESGPPQSLDKA